MTDVETLAEAKRRYPKGTVFNSTGGNKNVVVIDPEKFCMDRSAPHEDIESTLGCNTDSRVYKASTNTWATIISSPVPQIINSYEIY